MQINSTIKLALKVIAIAGLTAGLLDGACAVVFLGDMNVERVFRYVASGVIGQAAYTGAEEMIVYGLLVHFTIAITWATVYYFLYKKIAIVRRNFLVSGIVYGVVVWILMNLVVVPLTHAQQPPFTFERVAKNMAILIFAIGLPIAFITHRFWQTNTK